MNVSGVSTLIAAEFIFNSLIKLAESSARIRAANAEGRGLTAMEWQDIVGGNDQARSDAQAAVDLLPDEN